MACHTLGFADGRDGIQVWRLAENVLNKQSWRASKGLFFNLGIEQDNNPLLSKTRIL
jgi:hypothetical protein